MDPSILTVTGPTRSGPVFQYIDWPKVRNLGHGAKAVEGSGNCCWLAGRQLPYDEGLASNWGNRLELFRQYVFHLQPREVIHCLQRQGSPAATSKRCKLKPRRHFEPGGAAKGGPFFLPVSDLMPASFGSYQRIAREPRYSLTFALPLLLAYEVLALSLSGYQYAGVRNGADVLLKSLFLTLGGGDGLIIFGVLLIGGGGWFAWKDYRRSGSIEPHVFAGMATESVLYALAFGLVAGTLTSLLPGLSIAWHSFNLALAPIDNWSLPTQLMISLGAGIYEELLFRVLLVSGMAWLVRRLFSWGRTTAGLFAVALGALVFSTFHYIGPYGDSLELGSFTFRAVAGVLFSGLYLLRGFGITAWTHALYDVFLAVGVMG